MDIVGYIKFGKPPQPWDISDVISFEYRHLPETGKGDE